MEKALNIGSRLELFVDDYLIEKMSEGVKFELHHPVPKEEAIVHDTQWGGKGAYISVFKDGDIYKMYYHSYKQDESKITGPVLCYAESRDGIHWEKPVLGLVEFNGSRKNNIVIGPGQFDEVDPAHTTIFKDENPSVPEEERYKGLSVFRGLIALCSSDGFHWRLMRKEPIITKGQFDSQNLAFWDSVNQKYRAYWRYFTGGKMGVGYRAIRTATSLDFINWDEPKDLCYNPARPEEHLYTNQIKSYYRAPHIFIGFPTRYIDRGWSVSMEKLPDYEKRKKRAEVNQRYGTAITDALFMSSRDGVCFKIWDEAFLFPGPERPNSWAYGDNYIAWHVVETKSSLPGADNEISLYAPEGRWTREEGTIIRRYTLRIDGFVSLFCGLQGGEITTHPLIFEGKKLYINFSTSAVGSIKVEIQDKDGKPVPGYTFQDCEDIFGDTIKREVVFKGNKDVSSLSGQIVKLKFYLKEAHLFSFKFSD